MSSPENGKAVLDSIKDTINNFIVLAGSTEEMAEIFSGVIGKAPKKHIPNIKITLMFSVNSGKPIYDFIKIHIRK